MTINDNTINLIKSFARDQIVYYEDRMDSRRAAVYYSLLEYIAKGHELEEKMIRDFFQYAEIAISDRSEESAILAANARMKLDTIRESVR